MDLLPVPAPVSNAAANYDSSKHDECCLVCKRGMTDKAVTKAVWVEMTTDLKLIPVGHEAEGGASSQGMFPVGSECAKRIPKEYRRKVA